MTKREFMRFCSEYYGEKYDGITFDVMDAYLGKKSEQFFDSAAMTLVKRFSRASRIAPGPAEIERFYNEILDGIPEPLSLPDPIGGDERKDVGEKLHRLAERLVKRMTVQGKFAKS